MSDFSKCRSWGGNPRWHLLGLGVSGSDPRWGILGMEFRALNPMGEGTLDLLRMPRLSSKALALVCLWTTHSAHNIFSGMSERMYLCFVLFDVYNISEYFSWIKISENPVSGVP